MFFRCDKHSFDAQSIFHCIHQLHQPRLFPATDIPKPLPILYSESKSDSRGSGMENPETCQHSHTLRDRFSSFAHPCWFLAVSFLTRMSQTQNRFNREGNNAYTCCTLAPEAHLHLRRTAGADAGECRGVQVSNPLMSRGGRFAHLPGVLPGKDTRNGKGDIVELLPDEGQYSSVG